MYISSNAFVQLEISFILVIPGTIGWLSRKWSCYILSFSRVLNYSPFCVIVCSLVNAWLVFKNKSKKHLTSLLQDIHQIFFLIGTHLLFEKYIKCLIRYMNVNWKCRMIRQGSYSHLFNILFWNSPYRSKLFTEIRKVDIKYFKHFYLVFISGT